MPLQPNFIERFLIRRGTIPPILLDLGMSSFQVWLLLGAMEIGLFEHLKDGPHDVATLAKKRTPPNEASRCWFRRSNRSAT